MISRYFFVFLLIFVVIFVFSVYKRKSGNIKYYDEMQLQIRANAYQTGFYVTALGSLILIFLMDGDFLNLNQYASPSFSLFVVLMTGIITFAVYCIVKEAFFPINDRGNAYIILYIVICISNGWLAISKILDGSLWENGRITFQSGGGLVCAISFLVVLIAFVLKKVQVGREVTE